MKVKKHSEEDSENDQSIVTKEESGWQTITDGIDGSNDYLDSTSQCKFFLHSFCSVLAMNNTFDYSNSRSKYPVGSIKNAMCSNDQSNKRI